MELMSGLTLAHGQEPPTNSWSEESLNLEQVCRTCGVLSDFLIPILDGEGLQHHLEQKIHMYLHLQVLSNDILPSQLCYDCLSTILSWHSLYLKCQAADHHFRSIFGLKRRGEVPSRSLIVLSSETSKNLPASPVGLSQLNSEASTAYIDADPQATSSEFIPTKISSDTLANTSHIPLVRNLESPTNLALCDKLTDQYCQSQSESTSTIQSSVLIANSNLDSYPKHSIVEPPASPAVKVDNGPSQLSNRVSAIQSTSSSSTLPVQGITCSRSESVLVRNESVHPSKVSSEKTNTLNLSDSDSGLFMESSVIKEHRNVLGKVDESGKSAMVSVVRSTCLRRAPTAVVVIQNIGEEYNQNSESDRNVSKIVSVSDYHLDTSKKNCHDTTQIVLPETSSLQKETRAVDQSHICFYCEKFLSNPVLLLAHEKSHLTDENPPTTFVCKFCSRPQMSMSDLHVHYHVHETEIERHHRSHVNRKAHLCKQCGLMFTTEDKLAVHQRSHSDGKVLSRLGCKTCGETFSTRGKLSVHLWTHALKRSLKNFRCHICGKGYGTKISLMEHRLKHTDEEKSRAFKCVICAMAFGNHILLGKHRSSHSAEERARPYKCTICGKAFARNQTLQSHHLSHSDEKSHQCNQCGKFFKMRHSLLQHVRTHQDPISLPTFPCHICGNVYKMKSRLRDHLRVHNGEKPFKCSTCGKCFHKIYALHCHEVSHTESRPYTCGVCGKGFKWNKNLHQHMSIHENSNKFQQDAIVNKSISQPDSKKLLCQSELNGNLLSVINDLQEHKDNAQTGEVVKHQKTTICCICGKKLSRPGGLARHMKSIHGGVKAFKCDLCEREYATKIARDDHRRSHTGERPYTCSVCEKTFTSLSNLHIHNATHREERPYKCPYCEKLFKRRAHLVPHIRTHTGEKPYICEICSRGFAQSNDLQKHRLTHSAQRAHLCHCGTSFRVKRDLHRHEMKHHPHQSSQTNSQQDEPTAGNTVVVRKIAAEQQFIMIPGQRPSTISYGSNVIQSVVIHNSEVS